MAFSLGATAGIAGAYLLLKNPPVPQGAKVPQVPLPTPTVQTPPILTEIPKPSASTTESEPDTVSDSSASKNEAEQIEIVWTKPKEIDLNAKLDLGMVNGAVPWTASFRPTSKGFDIGYVKSGEYQGFRLIKWQWEEDGLGQSRVDRDMLISPDGKKGVLHPGFGDILEGDLKTKLTSRGVSMKLFVYEKLEPKEQLVLRNGKKLHLRSENRYTTNFACTGAVCGIQSLGTSREGVLYYPTTDDIVQVFGPGDAGVIVYDKDGSAFVYNTLPESMLRFSEENKKFAYGDVIKGSLITWDKDLGLNNVQYNPVESTGCGNTGLASLIDDSNVNLGGGIERIGMLDGEVVYKPTDPARHPLVQKAFDLWYAPDEEKTVSRFLRQYPVPVLITKDVLGRWMQMVNVEVVPAAECGKPVIYLYPEKTTNVSVRLPSFVNVTVSEPTYPRDGWKATANPDGSLQYADGKTYESLYWEGTGINYQAPKTGWVVKGSEVESFMDRTLAKYGLNQKESQDFKDFWLPIMQKHNLMRVSFLVEDWSKAAPLSVSPRPDTSIRIFMDWQPVSEPISIKAPNIKTPVRKGFTLVEWGGMLYR